VAAKPNYLRVEDVPQNVIENETAIYKSGFVFHWPNSHLREQTLASPPKNLAMLDKIVAGKVSKRLADISLNGQVIFLSLSLLTSTRPTWR
jgi:translation elongation factor EF-Ts